MLRSRVAYGNLSQFVNLSERPTVWLQRTTGHLQEYATRSSSFLVTLPCRSIPTAYSKHSCGDFPIDGSKTWLIWHHHNLINMIRHHIFSDIRLVRSPLTTMTEGAKYPALSTIGVQSSSFRLPRSWPLRTKRSTMEWQKEKGNEIHRKMQIVYDLMTMKTIQHYLPKHNNSTFYSSSPIQRPPTTSQPPQNPTKSLYPQLEFPP